MFGMSDGFFGPPFISKLILSVESTVQLRTFYITNGTRQGSVLSPTLFSVYLDGLLKELRNQGLGCHVAGVWMGAAGYADDLALLAQSRETMSKMLKICEAYGLHHNLVFSTDENPAKSKSKCLYICGKSDNNLPRVLPAPLQLYEKDLPWVVTATHLGHELHQSGTMDQDCKV